MTEKRELLTLFDPAEEELLTKFTPAEENVINQFIHMKECAELKEVLISAFYRIVVKTAVPHDKDTHNKIWGAASMLRAVVFLLEENKGDTTNAIHKQSKST